QRRQRAQSPSLPLIFIIEEREPIISSGFSRKAPPIPFIYGVFRRKKGEKNLVGVFNKNIPTKWAGARSISTMLVFQDICRDEAMPRLYLVHKKEKRGYPLFEPS
ncbi:hypothetical protein KAW48_11605, partial [candidate division WOR-3 bacterium]|nr:hypothetical protein [candidate division WOR-3 bacterium]